jgi:tetratricopeptide (TPR) repeat protein
LSSTRTRTNVSLLSAAAILLIAAAYFNFFHNSFHFDDEHVIVENAAIHSLANWPRFFTDAHTFSSLPSNATYRPLVTLSFALDYAVSHALNPVPFHATQLALLLITGVLLVFLCRELFGGSASVPLAIAAAAIFCVHTANTETMNFLSSRSELLSAIGFLAALLLFIRKPEWRRRGIYLIPLAIGALAKAPIVVFAAIVIAWVRIIERRTMTEAVKASVPSWITGIVVLIGLNAMNAPEWIAGGGSRIGYLLTQPYVWLHYARLTLLPVGLTADTDLETFKHWYDTSAIAGYAFVALLCIAIARLTRSRDTAPVAFGLAWFAITLLPTSSVFPLAEVANEHRLFFPLMGAIPATLWCVELLGRRSELARRYAWAALALAALALAYGTHVRNEAWRSEETLWRDVTEKSPRNGRGWMNYGLTQMEQAKYGAAKTAFDRASELTPNYGTLEINRGIVSAAMKDQGEAERHFRRAIALSSDRNSHYFMARWLLTQARGAEAEAHLAEAMRLAPSWIVPRKMAMQIAAGRGDATSARGIATGILAIDPTDAEASATLRDGIDDRCGTSDRCFAWAWTAAGEARHVEAAQFYRAANRYAPKATTWNNLGWSLAALGFRDDAAAAYRAATALDPTFTRARSNLQALGTQ